MEWINSIVQGVLLGGLFALFAAGLALTFGVMKLVNIAHGDLVVAFAYLAYCVMNALGIGPFSSLLIVVPVAAVVGYALQRLLLNQTLGSDELPTLLVTIGLSSVIQNLLLLHFSADSHRLHAGDIEVASWRLSESISVGVLPVIQFLLAFAIIAGLQLLLYRTPLGRALRATSDDQQVAQLMGLDTRHIFSIAMALSLAIVAVAGIFVAVRSNFNPFYGPQLLIFGFEAIVIGGLGSLWGTMAGGILLGVAQAVGGQINVGLPIIAGHLLFLAILIVRPHGLFPRAAL